MENSAIEWTDHTFNPWIGCARVSEGCANCYAAEREDHRFHRVRWGHGQPRHLTSEDYWREPRRWNRHAADAGARQRVFCASLADVMDDEVPQAWRDRLFALIAETPQLDWQLLTKRPQNFARFLPWATRNERPWPNVWLGASAENQRWLEQRAPILAATPAVVRFLSCEPLLSDLDLTPWLGPAATAAGGAVHWVIVGGESGRGARPMEIEWVRGFVGQCRRAAAACFVKQLGRYPLLEGVAYGTVDRKGGDVDAWPADLRVREFPMPAYGRETAVAAAGPGLPRPGVTAG